MSECKASHLDLRLFRLRLLLRRRVLWLRSQWGQVAWEDSGSTTVSDHLADLLLASEADSEAEGRFFREDPEAARIAEKLKETEDRLAAESHPPMRELAERFELTDFDQDVLWLCLAVDLDPRLEPLFAYVQDDVHRKHPTPHLALALFAEGPRRLTLRARFSPEAPLRRFRLISLEPGPSSATPAALRPIRVEDRIADYLRGEGGMDERLAERVWKVPPQGGLADSNAVHVERLRRQVEGDPTFGVNLAGPADSGKLAVASHLCRMLGRSLFRLDPLLLPTSVPDREEMLRLVERDAKLHDCAFLTHVPETQEKRDRAIFADFIERFPAPLILLSEHPWRGEKPMVLETLGKPGRAEQIQLWRGELGDVDASLDGRLEAIVQQFDLGPESISRAAADAHRRTSPGDRLDAESLWEACRRQTGLLLEDLAARIEPCYTWRDIVLPGDAYRQLQEIASQVAQRATVYEAWGFGAKLVRGRGITALFSGPSGTGKTMAAEILARHLALDLYRIDLAGVVSKYIGETEKNLRRIFDAAEQSGAILFFDEADALFGKRTEVKDSHDRYANIEVNYLLQRMESYSGLAILATNRKTALDRAFLRRLRFLVDFPFPDATSRKKIWQKVFPKKAPVDDVDWEFLAQLEIPGGNIRNIALNAAFLAAEKGVPIGSGDLMHAVRREYAKIDKLVTESEFGPYYKM